MSETGDIRIDEIMPSLNCNWPIVAFEESLIERQPKYKKLKAKEISVSGEIPVIDQGEAFIAGYTNDIANMFKGPLPVIIFGDHTRRFKFVDFDFAIGADGTRPLYPRQELDPKFFYHYLTALNLESQGYSRHYKFLKEASVPIPKIEEQHRIVSKLEVLFSKVDASKKRLERIPTLLKRFRQSVLAAACSGRLTEDWREQNPNIQGAIQVLERLTYAHESAGGHKRGNAAPATEEVHNLTREDFPDTWEMSEMRTLVEPSRPITYGILKPGPEIPGGIPYVRVADYPNDRLNLATIRRTTQEIEKIFARARLRKGDIMLSIRGTVGRLCMVPGELTGANITQDSARLSIQKAMDTRYVCWFLRNPMTQQRMRNATKGVAVRGINIGDVRALQVPIPPLEEQIEIVKRVEALFKLADEIQTRYEKGKAFVDKLTQSILAKAFRGELVPQDPNDESAEKMLEHILNMKK